MNQGNAILLSSLQLFAEGGGEGEGLNTGVSAKAAASQKTTGVKARAGGEGDPSRAGAPDAGAQEGSDGEFDRLIREKYKDAFDRRVQDILRRRLKEGKNGEKRAALAQTAAGQEEWLPEDRETRSQEPSPAGQPAGEPGPEDGEKRRVLRAGYQVSQWLRQARESQRLYPSLDLQRELEDPAFRHLLQAGVDVGTAYLVGHKDDILSAAMRHAAKVVEARLAGSLRSGGIRPPENGLRPQGTALTRQDVTKMSKADREAIRARAARGERIRL